MAFSEVVLSAHFSAKTLYKRQSLWNGFNGAQFYLCRIQNVDGSDLSYDSYRVYFDNNSTVMDPDIEDEIERVFIENLSTMESIELHGNADILGNRDHNLYLSQKRNQTVLNFLLRFE